MAIHPELMEIVRCPKCHGKVAERKRADATGLACEPCRLFYPVVDDIPNFLVDEALPLD